MKVVVCLSILVGLASSSHSAVFAFVPQPQVSSGRGLATESQVCAVGPERHYTLDDGTELPFYAMRFDKNGELLNKDDASHLIDAIKDKEKGYTDVYIFSHGWNNNEDDAMKAYDEWIQGYVDMREQGEFDLPPPYNPLLVGIIWPSKWDLSWKAPWSVGATESLGDSQRGELAEDLADLLQSEDERAEFKRLGMKDDLEDIEFVRMFDLMAPLVAVPDEEARLDPSQQQPKPYDIAALFFDESDDDAEVRGLSERDRGSGFVNPILLFSFWQMRGRSAVVGEKGLHPLLMEVLEASAMQESSPRFHLLGHSFGAGVILSAVAKGDDSEWSQKKIDSILLMQPAVVHKVFDASEDGVYRKVLDRTKSPIVLTFTNKDGPCRNWFHIALNIYSGNRARRFFGKRSDIPPDKYAALGGYPPVGLKDELAVLDPQPVGTMIDFPEKEVCAMRMHDVILGHTDIRKPGVYWLLYSLVAGK